MLLKTDSTLKRQLDMMKLFELVLISQQSPLDNCLFTDQTSNEFTYGDSIETCLVESISYEICPYGFAIIKIAKRVQVEHFRIKIIVPVAASPFLEGFQYIINAIKSQSYGPYPIINITVEFVIVYVYAHFLSTTLVFFGEFVGHLVEYIYIYI